MIVLFFGVFAFVDTYYSNLSHAPGPIGALVFPAAVIFSVGLVLLIHFILGKVRIPSAEKRKSAEAYAEAVKRLDEEAASLTARLTQTYESSVGLRSRLSEHLDFSSRRLKRAEAEHKENAAHPFWDETGEAAGYLYYYQRALDELARNAAFYYEQLKGREHNFPPFPVKTGKVPDAWPVLNEFDRVVRLGLVNEGFTKTLGQRGATRGRIRDYASLCDLTASLESSISDSMFRLRQAVSSDTAKQVEDKGVAGGIPACSSGARQ